MVTVGDEAWVYWRRVEPHLSRILSRVDRESFSLTYGSLDRVFWNWKFTDFAGARFQEGVFTLAFLYATPFQGNTFQGNPHLLRWARAALGNWVGLQYPDGSFDEAYPGERSLAATAFTGFYVGEGFRRLRSWIPEAEAAGVVAALTAAGEWLCRNDETHGVLSNHLAAAAAACHVIGEVVGDPRFFARRDHFVDRILRCQSAEGWYEEYGGADPGYQTHATFYLGWIWRATRDARLLESLGRASAFLEYCLHPDGTMGGEYGSRNTEFQFPAGYEILAGVSPEAARIALFMRRGMAKNVVVGPDAMDAQNIFPIVNNYLLALDAALGEQRLELAATGELPWQRRERRYFADAGLYFVSEERYYAIFAASKGGCLKVFDRQGEKLHGMDAGYWGVMPSGKAISSQALVRSPAVERGEEGILARGRFVRVNQRLFNPWLFLGFRLFTLIFGRHPGAARWIKGMLVRVLVRRRREEPLEWQRRVAFLPQRVQVWDRLTRSAPLALNRLRRDEKFSAIHMGSARYYQPQEIAIVPRTEAEVQAEDAALRGQLQRQGWAEVEFAFDWSR
ncbi:MAG: hypothetical protein HQL59_08510 [Magnetococcales bacterium]|nr:hypothetical protein [Magnetococcales bacterium]